MKDQLHIVERNKPHMISGTDVPPSQADSAVLLASPEPADSEVAWLRLEEFNRKLLQSDSATQLLDSWSGNGEAGVFEKVRAQKADGADELLPQIVREIFGGVAESSFVHRRVKLMRGTTVLSEAENWYLPSELTTEMNLALDNSDAPFGHVVQPLSFTRRTLSTEILWQRSTTIPDAVLRHSAVLLKPDLTPFSFVIETYTRQILQY